MSSNHGVGLAVFNGPIDVDPSVSIQGSRMSRSSSQTELRDAKTFKAHVIARTSHE